MTPENPADFVPDKEEVQSPAVADNNNRPPQNSTPAASETTTDTDGEKSDYENFDFRTANVEARLIKTAEEIIDQYILRYPAKALSGLIILIITIPRNDGGPPVQRTYEESRVVEEDDKGEAKGISASSSSRRRDNLSELRERFRRPETSLTGEEGLEYLKRDVLSGGARTAAPGVLDLDWDHATFQIGDWAGLVPVGKKATAPLPIPPKTLTRDVEGGGLYSSTWTSYEAREDHVASHTKKRREWTPELAIDMEMYRNQKDIRMQRLQKLDEYLKTLDMGVSKSGVKMRRIIDQNSPALSSFWLDAPRSPARHKLSLAMKDFAKWLTKTRALYPHENIASCEICADYPIVVNGLKAADLESGTTLQLLERQLRVISSRGEDASRTMWRNIRSAVEGKAGADQITFDVSDDPHYLRGIVPDPDLAESIWHDWRQVMSLIVVLAESTQEVHEALAWIDLSQKTAAQLERSSISAKSFKKAFADARQAAVSTRDWPGKTTVLAIQVIDLGYRKWAEQKKLDEQEKPKSKNSRQKGEKIAEDYTDLTRGCVIGIGTDGFVHWQASGWEKGYEFKKYAKKGGPRDSRKHSQEDVLLGAVQKLLVTSSGERQNTDRNNAYLELFGIDITSSATCGEDKKHKPIMKSVEWSLQLREIKDVSMFDIEKFTFGGESDEFREEDNDEADDDGDDYDAKADAALLRAYKCPGK